MKKNIISKSVLAIVSIVAAPAILLATPPPPNIPGDVPDSGSSLVLLAVSILGFFAFRRFKGK